MAKQKLKASSLMVWVGGKAVAFTTNCSLTLSTNYQEEKTKDDEDGDLSEPDYISWSVSTDALIGTYEGSVTSNIDDLIDAMYEMTPVKITIGPKALPNGKAEAAVGTSMPEGGWRPSSVSYCGLTSREGEATIESINPSGEVSGTAKYSVTFKGRGKLKKVDANSIDSSQRPGGVTLPEIIG